MNKPEKVKQKNVMILNDQKKVVDLSSAYGQLVIKNDQLIFSKSQLKPYQNEVKND